MSASGESPEGREAGIDVIVVTYESGEVIGECLDSLMGAAPRRGVSIRVVDNGSHDDGVPVAISRLGPEKVTALAENRGFASGVNAGLARSRASWIAVVNPDIRVPHGVLDRLVEILESHPRAGLIGPRVRDDRGREERSVGRFPTLAGEFAHAFYLERLLGLPGRHSRFPSATGPVDWTSGCFWLLRRAAVDQTGPLDESYFMYYEDSDYCTRLARNGWEVLATPEVAVVHRIGTGSRATSSLPADGGIGVLRYFRKFQPEVDERRLRSTVAAGWWIRRLSHAIRAGLGSRRSRDWVRRFDRSIELMRNA
jgi:GT2 family glycosyltransferase